MKKLLLTLAGVAAIAVGYLTLTGFRGHGCGGRGDPARMEKMVASHLDDLMDDISATPEQRTRILAVKDRLLAEGKALRAARPDLHQDLLAQWESPSPDVSRLHALIDERGDAMKGLAHKVADGLAEVHGVLTPEQRAQLAKKVRRHHGE